MRYRVVVKLVRLLETNPAGLTVAEMIARLGLLDSGMEYQTAKRFLNRMLEAMSAEYPLHASDEEKEGTARRWRMRGKQTHARTRKQKDSHPDFLSDILDCLLPESIASQIREPLKHCEHEFRDLCATARLKERLMILPAQSPLLAPKVKPLVAENILRGILARKPLKVLYESRSRKAGVLGSKFHAYGIIVQPPVIYVVGKMDWADDIRHYALHRFDHAEVLENKPFDQRPGFCLQRWVAEAGMAPSEQKTKLKFLMNKETAVHLREMPLSQDQKIEELEGDQCRISASVVLRDEITWWLLGFGDLVEIEKPLSLRRQMGALLKKAADNYRS